MQVRGLNSRLCRKFVVVLCVNVKTPHPCLQHTVHFVFLHPLSVGEDGSGKTTLMTKLQGAEHGKKGRGLEYLYLSVHDEDRDGE